METRPAGPRPLNPLERALLDALVRDVGPRLYAYVKRAFGRRVEADEIVAETFCRAAASIDRLRGHERQDMYLLTIARNLCRDRLRRPPPAALDEFRTDASARGSEPLAELIGQERLDALQRALAALPDSQREIVALRMSAGLQFEQIAELLQIPLGTALSRMHAAVQRLRDELGPTDDRALQTRKRL